MDGYTQGHVKRKHDVLLRIPKTLSLIHICGLKAYAIIGITLMHVLVNGEYEVSGFVFERLIPSFTNLVFLFMMVSGFGMCCGYYQKIIVQKISVEDFYKKRYIKIWPYFAPVSYTHLANGAQPTEVVSKIFKAAGIEK